VRELWPTAAAPDSFLCAPPVDALSIVQRLGERGGWPAVDALCQELRCALSHAAVSDAALVWAVESEAEQAPAAARAVRGGLQLSGRQARPAPRVPIGCWCAVHTATMASWVNGSVVIAGRRFAHRCNSAPVRTQRVPHARLLDDSNGGAKAAAARPGSAPPHRSDVTQPGAERNRSERGTAPVDKLDDAALWDTRLPQKLEPRARSGATLSDGTPAACARIMTGQARSDGGDGPRQGASET
jgi:hypothetical protein